LIFLASRHLGEQLRLHIEERATRYLGALLLFALGLALGVVAVSALSPLQRADLLQYLGGFLQAVKAGVVAGPRLMRAAAAANLKGLFLAWLIGASLVGLPVVCLLLVLRGFAIGFTVAFLAGELGGRGLWLTLLGVVPPNTLVVAAFLLVVAGSFELVLHVARHRRNPRYVWQAYGTYLAVGIAALILMLVGSALEAYVSPALLGALWPYLAG
jgi:stage II sporulation protein M